MGHIALSSISLELSVNAQACPCCLCDRGTNSTSWPVMSFWVKPSTRHNLIRTQSSPRVAIVSCFNSGWMEPCTQPQSQPATQNHPSTTCSQHPRAAPRSLPPLQPTAKPPVLSHTSWWTRPPCRCTKITTRTQRPLSTTRSTWSSTLPTSTCPCFTTLSTMMWFWRTLPTIFFTSLTRRGNGLRNWWSCRTNEVAKSSFRISRNQTVMTGRMGWMQENVYYTWKKVWISHYWTCANWLLKKWPSFMRLCWDSLPRWAGEIHQRTGWPHNQPAQVGGPWIWRGRGSLWQAHSGRQSRELSLRLPSYSHGSDFLVTKAVHVCGNYLYLFYNLYQIIHLCLSFVPFTQIK